MSTNNKLIGQFGERIAACFIVDNGSSIICRNYKCRYGEIDIISASGNDLVFTEVKTRRNMNYGYPFESVTCDKIKKIKKAIQYFMLTEKLIQNYEYSLKFNIISIMISGELTAAILAQEDNSPIDISTLKIGSDYELEQITDI